ncbi:MAG: hypothetical protein IPN20_25155 [Haliscomenobacter sp.]|nr:hypothetical protein [Haliscomenobacter sp.]
MGALKSARTQSPKPFPTIIKPECQKYEKIIKRAIAGTPWFPSLDCWVGHFNLYPQSLFANKFEHNQFTVYYNKDYQIEKEAFRVLLDSAYEIVEKSELHNPDFKYNVFLAHDNLFNQIEGLQGGDVLPGQLHGTSSSKRYRLNNQPNVPSKVDLTVLLVHEMVHILRLRSTGS